jgi:transposase
LPSVFSITLVRLDGPVIWLEAQGNAAHGQCPTCGSPSASLHDRYVRRPFDLPWRGRVVRLRLIVRRFRCPTATCAQQTFAEDFGPALARYARRTADAVTVLLQFAVATGGEAGARLAQAVGLPVSPDTLLRLLQQTGGPVGSTPRVLGVDDLALRRRHRYATLLVDLETRRPIDLVPDRDAETLATWLRAHPGVEIVVRDRSEAYAEGARTGAPDALQIADRFHLVQNAGAALEEVLRGRPQQVTVPRAAAAPSPEAPAATEPGGVPVTPDPSAALSATQRQRAQRRAARIARWEDIRARRAAGQTISQIARDLGKARTTIRRYLARPAPPPAPYVVLPRPGGLRSPMLQPYLGYLQDRWQAGCTNVSQLFRELAARGYAGSYSLLREALRPWRPPRGSARQRHRFRVRWLCLRPPEQLSSEEQRALAQVLGADPDLAHGYALLHRFRTLVQSREVAALEPWLTDAQASNLPPFIALANGLVSDRAAVEAGLTLPWSNGPVEGHVHRVKLIKRQGYGRAKLPLLRRRVLAS